MDSPYNKISLLIYFISFFFPVFTNADYKGVHAFFFVPFYFEEPVLLLCWLANISFALALLSPVGSWKKIFFGFTSVVFALILVFYKYIPGSGVGFWKQKEPDPAFYGIGYILWVSAFAITFVGSIINLKKKTAGKSHDFW